MLHTWVYQFCVVIAHLVEKNLLVNASGGVGDFKRKRGAQTFIEFNGVYSNKHISFVRKLPWMVLTWLTNCGMWYIKGRKDI